MPSCPKFFLSLIIAFLAIFSLPSNKLCLLLSNKLCLFLPRSVFAQVVINEFLPNPVGGAPEDGEFIELYNTGAGPVEISGWALDDIESGGTSPYIIPSVTVLGAGSFLAFYKSTTNIGLNNNGDTVRLLDNGSVLVNSYTYGSTEEGKSYGRSPDGADNWVVLESATPGSSNSAPALSPSPSPTPTPSSSATGTYKIKEVKNEDGETLNSVKVYVDGEYTHHYAPEDLTFGEGKYCDNDKQVECGFGEHTIKLEKNGYQDWKKTITVGSGFYDEDDPVMKKTASGSTDLTPTLTPTPKPTPTPTEKPTPTEEPTPTPTPSGEILGEEATPEPEATPSSFSFQNFLPHFFVGLGGLLLAVSGGSFLLPKLKKKYNIRKHGKGEEII